MCKGFEVRRFSTLSPDEADLRAGAGPSFLRNESYAGQQGKFHVAMTMSTNRVYQLQASTDLVNWTSVTNCTGPGSCTPTGYVDSEGRSPVPRGFTG